jgi:hypothetical protein
MITLESFCGNFLAPPSLPSARRQYDAESHQDMSELSIKIMGIGHERLKRTIQISKGLASPASKIGDRVPSLNFPQGYLREGKTPRVSKGQVGNLSSASIGEVVFTDTFQSGDSRFRYGQAYFDYASHWGDVFPSVPAPRLDARLQISVVTIGSLWSWSGTILGKISAVL